MATMDEVIAQLADGEALQYIVMSNASLVKAFTYAIRMVAKEAGLQAPGLPDLRDWVDDANLTDSDHRKILSHVANSRQEMADKLLANAKSDAGVPGRAEVEPTLDVSRSGAVQVQEQTSNMEPSASSFSIEALALPSFDPEILDPVNPPRTVHSVQMLWNGPRRGRMGRDDPTEDDAGRDAVALSLSDRVGNGIAKARASAAASASAAAGSGASQRGAGGQTGPTIGVKRTLLSTATETGAAAASAASSSAPGAHAAASAASPASSAAAGAGVSGAASLHDRESPDPLPPEPPSKRARTAMAASAAPAAVSSTSASKGASGAVAAAVGTARPVAGPSSTGPAVVGAGSSSSAGALSDAHDSTSLMDRLISSALQQAGSRVTAIPLLMKHKDYPLSTSSHAIEQQISKHISKQKKSAEAAAAIDAAADGEGGAAGAAGRGAAGARVASPARRPVGASGSAAGRTTAASSSQAQATSSSATSADDVDGASDLDRLIIATLRSCGGNRVEATRRLLEDASYPLTKTHGAVVQQVYRVVQTYDEALFVGPEPADDDDADNEDMEGSGLAHGHGRAGARSSSSPAAARGSAGQGRAGAGSSSADGKRASAAASAKAQPKDKAKGHAKGQAKDSRRRTFRSLDEGLALLTSGQLHPEAEVEVNNESESGWEGMTLLMAIAYTGGESAVSDTLKVIQHGGDVNARNRTDGITPLHYACQQGRADLVRLLLGEASGLNRGYILHDGKRLCKAADVNAVENQGWTPAHYTTLQLDGERRGPEAGTAECMRLLVNHGADLTLLTDEPGQMNVMHLAAQEGLPKILRIGLKSGAVPVDSLDQDGNTALHYAAFQGDPASVKDLLAAGAAVDQPAANGWTAVHNAAAGDGYDAAIVLIKAGADVNARDSDGCTPLNVACSNVSYKTVKVLLEHGADVNTCDNHGQYPVHDLCGARVVDKDTADAVANAARYLISARANLNAQLPDGRTALHLAAETGLPDVLKAFTSRHGEGTPLEGSKLLGSTAADPNIADKKGWTPLHYAAFVGDAAAVRILQSRYASTSLKTGNGKTARDLAVEQKHKHVVEALDNVVASGR